MSQSSAKPPEKSNKDVAIALAVISGVVAVLVAVFGCLGTVAAPGVLPFTNWFLNRTPEPAPNPQSTALASSTSNPGTATQNVPCAQTQTCPAGADWASACIAEYNWSVYSSSDFPETPRDERECYAQPILDVFYTKDNGLYVLAQPRALQSSRDHGLFTELPQSGKVSFTLDLNRIENGQIWIGVFEKADVDSAGVLLVAPPGEVCRQAFALKTMPTGQRIEVSKIFENHEGKYAIGFELEYGSIIAQVEGVAMTPIPFTPRTRWLFLGYRAKLDDPENGTADIQALFTDLKIE